MSTDSVRGRTPDVARRHGGEGLLIGGERIAECLGRRLRPPQPDHRQVQAEVPMAGAPRTSISAVQTARAALAGLARHAGQPARPRSCNRLADLLEKHSERSGS